LERELSACEEWRKSLFDVGRLVCAALWVGERLCSAVGRGGRYHLLPVMYITSCRIVAIA
jgi:hypothetical protein